MAVIFWMFPHLLFFLLIAPFTVIILLHARALRSEGEKDKKFGFTNEPQFRPFFGLREKEPLPEFLERPCA